MAQIAGLGVAYAITYGGLAPIADLGQKPSPGHKSVIRGNRQALTGTSNSHKRQLDFTCPVSVLISIGRLFVAVKCLLLDL